jgi:hypothetical protein
VDQPVVEGRGAELLVELQRRFVPVEGDPLQADVAAFLGDAREVLEDLAADAAAAVLGLDIDVLEPDAGAALEAREGRVEERVADDLAADSTTRASAARCSNSVARRISGVPTTSSRSFS